MLSITKTTNFQGISTIDGKAVVAMNAMIHQDGKYSLNYAVQNNELYTEHKEEITTDIDLFKKEVESIVE